MIKSASIAESTGKIGRIVSHRYGEFYFFEHFRLWQRFSSILARFHFRTRVIAALLLQLTCISEAAQTSTRPCIDAITLDILTRRQNRFGDMKEKFGWGLNQDSSIVAFTGMSLAELDTLIREGHPPPGSLNREIFPIADNPDAMALLRQRHPDSRTEQLYEIYSRQKGEAQATTIALEKSWLEVMKKRLEPILENRRIFHFLPDLVHRLVMISSKSDLAPSNKYVLFNAIGDLDIDVRGPRKALQPSEYAEFIKTRKVAVLLDLLGFSPMCAQDIFRKDCIDALHLFADLPSKGGFIVGLNSNALVGVKNWNHKFILTGEIDVDEIQGLEPMDQAGWDYFSSGKDYSLK